MLTEKEKEEIYKILTLDNLTAEVDGNIYVEEWRSVDGYVGCQISSFGRFKNIAEQRRCAYKNKDGSERIVFKKFKPQIIRQTFIKDKKRNPSYLTVNILGKRRYLTHRLVAIAFHENPENKEFVNHKNGIKTINAVWNVEWNTKIENEQHAWKVLKRNGVKGEEVGRSKLNPIDIVEIRESFSHGYRPSDLAKIYNVSASTITNIHARRIWRHI